MKWKHGAPPAESVAEESWAEKQTRKGCAPPIDRKGTHLCAWHATRGTVRHNARTKVSGTSAAGDKDQGESVCHKRSETQRLGRE